MAETIKQENKATPGPRDAAAVEADLHRLEMLQEQLDQLRGALPSIVAPLKRPDLTGVERLNRLKKAAIQASTGIETLKANWTSDESQAVFKAAEESFQRNGDLSEASSVPLYGWGKPE